MPRLTVSVDLDDQTYAAFHEVVARTAGGDTEAVMEQLVCYYVMREQEPEGYDEWFRAEVEEALREADAPDAKFYSNEEVMAEMRQIVEQRFAGTEKLAG